MRDLTVSVNGEVVADIPNASFTAVQVKPGQTYVVGEGGALSWPRRDIVFDVSPNEIRFVVWRTSKTIDSSTTGQTKLTYGIHWDIASDRQGRELIRDFQYIHSRKAIQEPSGKQSGI
ncbi:MAG TPA: hypothetical protein VFK88_01090 [Gallionella sp.]|nr:hypothetical protein [Gallionella sp.]